MLLKDSYATALNILPTPLFGGIYDKKGKGATIMILGSILLILVHGLFSSSPKQPDYRHGIGSVLGIAFSCAFCNGLGAKNYS